MEEAAPSTSRRGLLSGAAAGAAGTLAGCTERFWSQAEPTGTDQIQLTIKTVPADEDEFAPMIASQLRENYEAVGIDASPETVAEAELYRDVLLRGEYDVFVVRHTGLQEFDSLYGLLHADFYSERGWQNPFNFSDVTVDGLLEDQRATDDGREEILEALFEHLLETTPYTVVAYPDAISGVRDHLEAVSPLRRHRNYLSLLAENEDDPTDHIEVGTYGARLTEGLNPLVVDRHRIDGLLDLLYDPLVRRIDGEYVPWLATAVEWDDEGVTRARVQLREGLEWHDGYPLDADDVAFTVGFLEDTSIGEVEGGVPAPRFRGRTTLIRSTRVVDSQTVEFVFDGATPTTARRALTIPLLPEHVWSERSGDVGDRRTEALVHENEHPVGSGLFAVADEVAEDAITLEPFEDHVFAGLEEPPVPVEGFFVSPGVDFRIYPNSGTMVDTLLEGDIDATTNWLGPDQVRSVREADGISSVSEPTDAFYLIGYNCSHPDLGNHGFRRACSTLIDRDHTVSERFGSDGRLPDSAPRLFGIDEGPLDGLEDDLDLLEFPGENGEVDPDRARSLFTDVGYRYEDDALLE